MDWQGSEGKMQSLSHPTGVFHKVPGSGMKG